TKLLQSVDGKLEAFYFAMGDRDVVTIVDLPDAVSAAAVSLTGSATGLFKVRTTPLLSAEEIDRALARKLTFRGPGQSPGQRPAPRRAMRRAALLPRAGDRGRGGRGPYCGVRLSRAALLAAHRQSGARRSGSWCSPPWRLTAVCFLVRFLEWLTH